MKQLLDRANRPVVRFAGVGVVNTAVDFIFLNLLRWLGAPVAIAVAVGFTAGAVNGYLLNSHLVFKQERSYHRFGKYLAVALVGLLWTELIVDALHTRTNWLPINAAKLVAVVLVFFWNYLLSKTWAFK